MFFVNAIFFCKNRRHFPAYKCVISLLLSFKSQLEYFCAHLLHMINFNVHKFLYLDPCMCPCLIFEIPHMRRRWGQGAVAPNIWKKNRANIM